MSIQINPSRLRLARKRRGLTKTALAKAAGVSVRTISLYENGEREDPPSQETLDAFAPTLVFPIDFFFGDDIDEIDSRAVSFRSMARMTAAQRNQAIAAGEMALQLDAWITRRFELPIPNVPDLRDETPAAAAESLRDCWALGNRPVRNIVHLLEANGVRVYSLYIPDREIDAFSFWYGNTPFMFINTNKSAERGRFDAAHELGHLTLHRHLVAQGREAEQQADAFASAFLMPEDSVLSLVPYAPNLTSLIERKKNWLVSVGALARRLKDVGRLSEWQYRNLCIEISQRGYRTKEPDGIQQETSQILKKVFAALRSEGVTKDDIAADLKVTPHEIDALVFNLAVFGVQGGRPKTSKPTGSAARLRLVK